MEKQMGNGGLESTERNDREWKMGTKRRRRGSFKRQGECNAKGRVTVPPKFKPSPSPQDVIFSVGVRLSCVIKLCAEFQTNKN